MGKEEIRNAVKIRKKQLDNCQRKIASDRCFDNLEKCPEFLSAQHVLVFNSLPDEIDRLEAEVAALNQALAAPGADYAALSARLAQTQSALDTAVETYLTLEERAETLKK